MGNVEGVVFINVSVGVLCKLLENVGLKGVRGFHDKGVQIKPPEPVNIDQQ